MPKKRLKLVETQDVSRNPISGASYEHYVASSGTDKELVLANPDQLPEQNCSPSNPQLVMGEAIEHLQGRQREVYLSVMREDRSLAETGEVLGISKSTVQVHLDRAIAFITAYCKQAEARGRI